MTSFLIHDFHFPLLHNTVGNTELRKIINQINQSINYLIEMRSTYAKISLALRTMIFSFPSENPAAAISGVPAIVARQSGSISSLVMINILLCIRQL